MGPRGIDGVVNPSAARAKRVAEREPRGWGPAALMEDASSDPPNQDPTRDDDLDVGIDPEPGGTRFGTGAVL